MLLQQEDNSVDFVDRMTEEGVQLTLKGPDFLAGMKDWNKVAELLVDKEMVVQQEDIAVQGVHFEVEPQMSRWMVEHCFREN
ncbi:jg7172 [Pararge aegeria aegeria]|uniref:Jg7172 protein n=1 Tax=Pararge aegeria aegeria TaxID=348720 RepID=A0A8S4R6U2_9NEOP|nr:jg7172 [Pararge aegeria aegeria]